MMESSDFEARVSAALDLYRERWGYIDIVRINTADWADLAHDIALLDEEIRQDLPKEASPA